MRRFFAKKTVTAALFLFALFVMSFFNLKQAYPFLQADIQQFVDSSGKSAESPATLITNLTSTITTDVYQKYAFVETYGFIQKLLDKNEINNFEVVKDKNGYLYYTYFTNGPNNIDTIAGRMLRLKQAAAKNGSKVMYLMSPDKYMKGQSIFETGIPYNYANETADNFLSALRKDGVDTLDFRTLMKQDGKYTLSSFYKTDHHWTVQTSFWAFTKFVDVLQKKYGLQFPHKAQFTNLSNYNQIVYKDSFIGSMGEKEGILYTGAEDFTFIYPKFATNFNFYAQTGADLMDMQGRFEKAITYNSILYGKGDIYDARSDKFFTYMDGNPGFIDIRNDNEPKGARVLFIKDSLMVPVASFFALGCAQVDMIDPRYFAGSIEDYVKKHKFDYVFVSYSPQNLTEQFFPFFKSNAK